MKIHFCGGAETVTGSCFLVITDEFRFLVDCGMFQGSKALKERNYGEFLFEPKTIDFVLLTHAHIDHSGLIPKLYKKGFRGKVMTTAATKSLCAVVLPDSGYIQEMEVERKNRKIRRSGGTPLAPIYTAQDAENCLQYIEGYDYEERVDMSPNLCFRFQDAGHILGSAIIEIVIQEGAGKKKLVFSGDLGNINQPIIDDPTMIGKADFIVMESTYGNRYHLQAENKIDSLISVVKSTYKKGGNLVIPSFAVERTQDLIYELKLLSDQGKIPRMNIYVDSPMAIEATKVFYEHPEFCTDSVFCEDNGKTVKDYFVGDNVFYVLSAEESKALNEVSRSIIISASGMAEAGRIKHHLKHNLWRPESTVLFVGYQAQGTLGRRILDGEQKVRIHGEEIAVKADIVRIEGFSAHADQKGLLAWLKEYVEKPDMLFLVHGEEEALGTLQRVIASELGWHAEIPKHGAVCDLEFDALEWVSEVRVKEPEIKLPELSASFRSIKEKIEDIARLPGRDTRTLERLLAQISEIEKELNRAV